MIQSPEPLTAEHALGGFDSGVSSLDDWLRRRALQNQASGASRTFVVCDAGQVVAYYALAASAVAPDAAPGRFRRNMPDPIPVVVLARLAITRDHQGRGLGRALFQDAANRVIHAADTIGIRGLLVHAISEEAKAFYVRLGLDPSPLESMTLMTTVADLKATLD
ncbi:MAG: GNAT family N-acetyltransferase [Burkholderiaceae bacterium]|nr:GNAT family N-acetyltransferase [Burkholderiaceae bacterium]